MQVIKYIVVAILAMGCGEKTVVHYSLPKAVAPKVVDDHAGHNHETTFDWDAPKEWKEGKTSSMRIGSYSVDVKKDDGSIETVDVSIIKLGGDGGGHTSNVNRWRGQVGLPERDAADLAVDMHTLEGKVGKFVYVMLMNDKAPETAILGSMISGPDWVLYVKLSGSQAAAQKIADQFKQFSKSISYTGGSHDH